MSIEKEGLHNREKSAEGKKTPDRASETSVIKSASANEQSQRLKLQDGLKSFKLTGDGQPSFTIVLDDGSSVHDKRSKRIEPQLADRNIGSEAGFGVLKPRDNGQVQELLTSNDQALGKGLDAPARNPGTVDKDYAHKGTTTRAPDNVTVIVAEGTPGHLWKPKGDVAVDPMKTQLLDYFTAVSDETFKNDLQQIQRENPSKNAEPLLVYINACYSGEGNAKTHTPDGSVASRIASKEKCYVLGNIGLGNGAFPDETFPDTDPYPTPLGERHGNPFEKSKVRLFGPDGKPVPGAEFDTPVDWKKVQQKIDELEQAKKI